MILIKRIFMLYMMLILVSCDGSGPKEFIEINGKAYISGSDYTILKKPITFNNSIRANVVEIFWYGCPHCQSFEPILGEWIKDLPDNLLFARSPAIWSEAMIVHARAYYIYEQLKLDPKLHSQLFNTIIALRQNPDVNQHKNTIAKLFTLYGVDRTEFDRLYDSTVIKENIGNALSVMKAASIRSTPSFLINGRYLLDAGDFKTSEELLEVANYLMNQEVDGQLSDWW